MKLNSSLKKKTKRNPIIVYDASWWDENVYHVINSDSTAPNYYQLVA